jgi:hypothetical protein
MEDRHGEFAPVRSFAFSQGDVDLNHNTLIVPIHNDTFFM